MITKKWWQLLTVKNDNICTYFVLSFMLSFLGCYLLCYHAEMRKFLTICEEAVSQICLRIRSLLNFIIYEEFFFFISEYSNIGYMWHMKHMNNNSSYTVQYTMSSETVMEVHNEEFPCTGSPWFKILSTVVKVIRDFPWERFNEWIFKVF
jgi:hypothetical protein